ncbi:hypothetical protein HY450_03270 [Candidatus Pacearchaeota archaeon]|nr:hypothetical protein [Candidatus Pacearchaeota archaeon]
MSSDVYAHVRAKRKKDEIYEAVFYSYDSCKGFLDFIAKFGEFAILNRDFFKRPEGAAIVTPNMFDEFGKELAKSREAFASSRISAINVYDLQGELMHTFPNVANQLADHATIGRYLVGLDGKVEAIGVVCTAHDLFNLDEKEKKSVLGKRLEGKLNSIKDKLPPRKTLYFSEIYRRGYSFYGKSKLGDETELPPVKIKGLTLTPFLAFVGPEEEHEKMGRLLHVKVPAWEGFGRSQECLENVLHAARKYNSPIEFT